MYLFEATGLTKTQINPDDDEVIEVDIVSNQEALSMIDQGRIQDAKSILGLLRVLAKPASPA
jgi:ADP-ribose pyrophosphatase